VLKIRMYFGGTEYANRNLGRFRLSVTSGPNVIQAAKLHQELKASGLAELEISLGNAHGRQARVDQAADAFDHALDLAADRDSRLKILEDASAHAGVLDKLTELRPADGTFLDILARHYQRNGDTSRALAVSANARTRYEQQLAAAPTNARLARDLADLLLDLSPGDAAHLTKRNWTILKPIEMKSSGGATFTLLDDGSILAGGPAANTDIYTITTKARLSDIQAFLLEAIPHENLPLGSSGRRERDGNFALTEFKISQSVDGRSGSFARIFTRRIPPHFLRRPR
jgi:tetratricopeptide (TPR) repeat protein